VAPSSSVQHVTHTACHLDLSQSRKELSSSESTLRVYTMCSFANETDLKSSVPPAVPLTRLRVQSVSIYIPAGP